jgi:4-methylaminobutanoate oxidase (formaldehyde-forming)
VAGDVGRVVYTQWCNDRGGIEADLTVTRLAADRFLVVVSDVSHRHVERLLRDEVGAGEFMTVTDVTAGFCLLSVQGPKSRELLSRVSPDDVSNDAFPYLTAREVEIGYSRVLVMRVTYVGELGYELHIPSDQAASVWEVLESAGRDLGLRPVGLAAMESLRIEKGYRDYGVDIDVTDTPITAGLAFAVAWDKGDFRGRAALEASRADRSSRLVNLILDDPGPVLHGSEPVFRNGAYIGFLQAGAFGHTLGASVGLASVTCADGVTAEWLGSGDITVTVAGVDYPARLSLRPLYDPERTRVLA